MRIILAEDDPVFRELTAWAIRSRTQHEVIEASTGTEVLEVVLGGRCPDVLVLDRGLPELSGLEVCRRVRDDPAIPQPYILLTAPQASDLDVIMGLDAGADDMLSKPVPFDLLEAQLRLVERRQRWSEPASPSLLSALTDARAEGHGELVIRDGKSGAAGRVFFHEHRVAWVYFSDRRGSLAEILAPEVALDDETADELVHECRRSGTRLGEALARWGILDVSQLQRCLRSWMSQTLTTIQRIEQPRIVFIPQYFEYSGGVSFELEELLTTDDDAPRSVVPRTRPSLTPRSTQEDPSMRPILERCMKGNSIKSVAVVDRATGLCLGALGSELNPDVIWSNIQHMTTVAGRDPIQAGVVTTSTDHHLVSAMTGTPERLIYAVFTRADCSLGAALAELRIALSQYSPSITLA